MVTLHSRVRVLSDAHMVRERNPTQIPLCGCPSSPLHRGRREAGHPLRWVFCGSSGVFKASPAILPALALPTVGGKQSGVETKEQPTPEFSVPQMTPGRTRQVLILASIFSTGGKCPLQKEDSTLDFPFCVTQHAEHW